VGMSTLKKIIFSFLTSVEPSKVILSPFVPVKVHVPDSSSEFQ
jgi:hypothetical protein